MSEQVNSLPWPPGTATGVGSHPGEDPDEAVRLVLDQLPDLPYLPELPARGPGADMLGRTAALLAELPVELRPSGWRLADRPGRDLRRAHSLLARDLDALEEQGGQFTGPLKLQAVGPWTLAGGIELPYGDKVLADPGAVRDLTASLAEGLIAHIGEVRRRVPGARVLLQLDEPSLPAALTGSVRTASGFGMLRAVEQPIAEAGLRTVIEAVSGDAYPLVHCCARHVPVSLLRASGARAISLDFRERRARAIGENAAPRAPGERAEKRTKGTQLASDVRAAEEQLAEAIETGTALFAGVVAPTGDDRDLSDPGATVEPVRELWSHLGLAPELLRAVVVTPGCGLAGASPPYVRAALRRCREAARVLAEESQ